METHSPHASTHALYQPTHGTTRRGRPRLNYTWTISRGWLEWRPTNSWRCHKTVKPGVNLWSRVLIYNHPTSERERERERWKLVALCMDHPTYWNHMPRDTQRHRDTVNNVHPHIRLNRNPHTSSCLKNLCPKIFIRPSKVSVQFLMFDFKFYGNKTVCI